MNNTVEDWDFRYKAISNLYNIRICKRPPLGLTPRYIWEDKVYAQRIQSIKEAIERYTKENLSVPQEWVEEYNELIEKRINNG